MADPGFPVGGGVDLVGGRGPRRGDADSRGGYALEILYVKPKESGPLGGHAPGHVPSRSANGLGYSAVKLGQSKVTVKSHLIAQFHKFNGIGGSRGRARVQSLSL